MSNKNASFKLASFICGLLLYGMQPDLQADTAHKQAQKKPSNTSPSQAPIKTKVKTETHQTRAPIQDYGQKLTPKEGLDRLLLGNQRFIADQRTCPESNQMRRAAIESKQRPFAIVLGCSDSRIPPEIAFDQDVGDIFVVRVAGNILGPVELDSIEYSVRHNGSSIIVVLGHQSCGAVEAVLDENTKDVQTIIGYIKPAIEKAQQKQKDPLTLMQAVEINVRNSVKGIKNAPALQKYIKANKVDVVGAYYDLSTGAIRILD